MMWATLAEAIQQLYRRANLLERDFPSDTSGLGSLPNTSVVGDDAPEGARNPSRFSNGVLGNRQSDLNCQKQGLAVPRPSLCQCASILFPDVVKWVIFLCFGVVSLGTDFEEDMVG